jgi:hypothetical protein
VRQRKIHDSDKKSLDPRDKNSKNRGKRILLGLYTIYFATSCIFGSKKPKFIENIGITVTYEVKIFDFGISRQVVDRMTTDPGSVGYQVSFNLTLL